MSATLLALLGFLSWTLFLLVLMEAIRSKLVLTRAVAANVFSPHSKGLSPFMMAVTARFTAFAVQMAIAAYWAVMLRAS